MNLSTRGRYGLRAIIDLAALHCQTNCSVKLKDIAARQGISVKYLEILFNTLKQAGLVRSQRGLGGGYSLCKIPSKITVLDVLTAFETPNNWTEDLNCSLCRHKKLDELYKKINQHMYQEFKKTTIKDLM